MPAPVPDSPTNTSTIARNSFWYAIELFVGFGAALLTSILVARTFGAENLGDYVTLVWLTNVTIAVGSLGLPATTRKYVAEYLNCGEAGVARATYLAALDLQTYLAVGVSVVGLGWAYWFNDRQQLTVAVLLIVAMAPRIVAAIPSMANSAAESMRRNTGPSLAGELTTTLLTLVGLALGWGLPGVAAPVLIGNTLECVLKLYSVEKWFGGAPRGMVSPELKQRILTYSTHGLALMLLNIVVWDKSDLLILRWLSSDPKSQASYFSVSFNLVERVLMIPNSFGASLTATVMAIKSALEARGDKRSIVLVPDSAHGTNPATAALLGYRVESIPVRADGTVDPEEVKKKLSPQVAAIMLTNPNTCGLFERDVVAIAEAVHAAGAYFYADGANFNAIVGKVRPGDLGVDAMHINLHKTFSTPHGGGGPGPARWRCRRRWHRSCRCLVTTVADAAGVRYVEHAGEGGSSAASAACAPSTARWACSCARSPTCSARVGRHAAGERGRGAQRQLRARLAGRPDVAAVRRPALHARGAVRRSLAGRHRRHHARFRQGHDRRGLSPHDRVLPAGGARRHADRADGIGIEAQPRPVHRELARAGRSRESRRRRPLPRRAPLCPPPPPRRDQGRARAAPPLDAARRAQGGRGIRPRPSFPRSVGESRNQAWNSTRYAVDSRSALR